MAPKIRGIPRILAADAGTRRAAAIVSSREEVGSWKGCPHPPYGYQPGHVPPATRGQEGQPRAAGCRAEPSYLRDDGWGLRDNHPRYLCAQGQVPDRPTEYRRSDQFVRSIVRRIHPCGRVGWCFGWSVRTSARIGCIGRGRRGRCALGLLTDSGASRSTRRRGGSVVVPVAVLERRTRSRSGV